MTWKVVFDMPNKDYHATKHIGSTSAKNILKSRQKFADLLAKQSKTTQAMRDGEAFHLAVLQPTEYARRVASEPVNPKTGKAYGVETIAYQSFLEQNPDAIFPPDFIAPMIERMPADVASLLTCGIAESSYFGTVDGVAVKFRPDYLVGTDIYDLKSIDDIDNIDRAIVKYHYWFSAAWYRKLAFECTGKKHTFTLIFAEKSIPYRWRIVELDAEYFMLGDNKVDYALKTISECQDTGDWRDYDDTRIMVGMPDWMDEPQENESDGEE